MINVTSPNMVPKEPHWAIIRSTSVSIPGDERSRTNPGHGYPAETRQYVTYEAYTDREAWEEQVIYLTERGSESFRAMFVTPAEVKVSVSVKEDRRVPRYPKENAVKGWEDLKGE